MKHRIRRAALMAALVCGATAVAGAPANAAEPETGTVTNSTLGFGGTYTGITYDAIWNGGRPSTLSVPSRGHTVQATAYFVNQPKFNPYPLMTPRTGPMNTTYYWQAACVVPGKGQQKFNLTAPRTVEVPVHPTASVFRIIPPSRTVTDTVTLPAYECNNISIRFTMNATQNGSNGMTINYFTPEARHTFNPERDAAGNIRLYTVVDGKQVEEVDRSGKLTNVGPTFFRYYFTNCALAREFIGAMASVVDPSAKMGIIDLRSNGDVVGAVVGARARMAGKPDISVWGLEEGAALAYDSAEVVYDGSSPLEGCRV